MYLCLNGDQTETTDLLLARLRESIPRFHLVQFNAGALSPHRPAPGDPLPVPWNWQETGITASTIFPPEDFPGVGLSVAEVEDLDSLRFFHRHLLRDGQGEACLLSADTPPELLHQELVPELRSFYARLEDLGAHPRATELGQRTGIEAIFQACEARLTAFWRCVMVPVSTRAPLLSGSAQGGQRPAGSGNQLVVFLAARL